MATFVVDKGDNRPIEIEAETAEQDPASTRVTFKDEDGNAVGSFLNVHAWYKKADA